MTTNETKQVLTRKDYMNGEYQREVSQFVGREVIYCVSSLMTEMFDNPKCQDELYEVFNADNYNDAVYDFLRAQEKQDWPDFEKITETYGDGDLDSTLTASKVMQWLEDEDNIRSFAEDFDIEPYEQEIFEYWIVSGWLGEKLQEHGEAVLMDHEFLPTPIWGRTTTGQGIAGDEVIMTIYDELHKQSA